MIDENRTFTKDLPVKLTVDEVVKYAELAASKLHLQGEVEEKRKTVNKEFASTIATLINDQQRLARAISDHEELRPVLCFERFHAGTIEVVRKDTNEVVDFRAATTADLQTSLPLPAEDGDEDEEEIQSAAPGGEMASSSSGSEVWVADREGEDDELEDQEDDEDEEDDAGARGEPEPVMVTPPGGAPQLDDSEWGDVPPASAERVADVEKKKRARKAASKPAAAKSTNGKAAPKPKRKR